MGEESTGEEGANQIVGQKLLKLTQTTTNQTFGYLNMANTCGRNLLGQK